MQNYTHHNCVISEYNYICDHLITTNWWQTLILCCSVLHRYMLFNITWYIVRNTELFNTTKDSKNTHSDTEMFWQMSRLMVTLGQQNGTIYIITISQKHHCVGHLLTWYHNTFFTFHHRYPMVLLKLIETKLVSSTNPIEYIV